VGGILPTLRYWTQTEVHASFFLAANVLLGFFPFLIVSVSLSRLFLADKRPWQRSISRTGLLSDATGDFLSKNFRSVDNRLVALGLLLFSSTSLSRWKPPQQSRFKEPQLSSQSFGEPAALFRAALWLFARHPELRVGSSSGLRLSGDPSWFSSWPRSAHVADPVFDLHYLPNGRPPLARAIAQRL
jgi:hypothetical protein